MRDSFPNIPATVPSQIKGVLRFLVDKFETNNYLKSRVRGVLLLGSYSNGEFLPILSDLDILLICRANQWGSVSNRLLAELSVLRRSASKLSPVKLSFLPHTYHDFRGYVDVTYLHYYSLGLPLNKRSRGIPKRIVDLRRRKDCSLSQIKKLVIYNLTHKRFNLNRRYASEIAAKNIWLLRAEVKKYIDDYIESCQWALHLINCWPETKKEVCSKIGEQFPGLDKLFLKTIARNRGEILSLKRRALLVLRRRAVEQTNVLVEKVVRKHA